MPDNGSELRGIAWTQTFPFLRLFRTFGLAIAAGRLALALACVLGAYVGGRILDGIWLAGDGGALVAPSTHQSEIDAYAGLSEREFKGWLEQTRSTREQLAVAAAVDLGSARDRADAQRQLTTRPAGELIDSPRHDEEVRHVLEFINTRLDTQMDALDDNDEPSAAEKRRRRESLERAADCLRFVLDGREGAKVGLSGDVGLAMQQLDRDGQPLAAEQRRLVDRVLRVQTTLNTLEQSEPRGPFIALLDYESRCFAGAIRGVCTLRWGFAGGPGDEQPSLLGSVTDAGRGICWLVTQRPWYALFYAVIHFVVFAFFGGAICRHAAIQSARDETISLREALQFAWEKYAGLLLAPVVPAGIFLLGAVAMFLGGLVGAIPYLGELLAGLLYGLALLGGFALAMVFIATLLGFHLMWPTIAVEGSDAFDAVTHAAGYIGQRAWNTGFYSLILLLYGGVLFVVVRLIAMLLLKLTHVFTGAGMSLFGVWSSAETSTLAKLDAMWHMPAWSDLSLLPSTGRVPFWGTFHNAPLDGTEWLAMVLIACWVFLVVSLVGAFVVSFFFCGSTQMYFLLRRDVDATDYDEIFYEEPEEEFPAEEPMAGLPDEAEAPTTPAPPAAAPPPETPPAETPPADEPPADTPSEETPPEDTPSEETPAEDTPPEGTSPEEPRDQT